MIHRQLPQRRGDAQTDPRHRCSARPLPRNTAGAGRSGRRLAAAARRSLDSALALLCLAATALGQAPPAPAAPVVTASRSWYVEAFLVVVLMGLALYVVCRSSRRN